MSWRTLAGAAALAEGKGLFAIHENVLIAISDENAKRLVSHVRRISEAGHSPVIICEGSSERAVEVFGKVPNVTIFGSGGSSKWTPGNNGAGSYVHRGGVGDFRKWVPSYIRNLAPKAIFVANIPWENPQPAMDNFLEALDLTGRLVAKVDVTSAPHKAPARVLIEEFRALRSNVNAVSADLNIVPVIDAVKSGNGRVVVPADDVVTASAEFKMRLDRLARAGNDVWVVSAMPDCSHNAVGVSRRIRIFVNGGADEITSDGFLSSLRRIEGPKDTDSPIRDRIVHEGALPTLMLGGRGLSYEIALWDAMQEVNHPYIKVREKFFGERESIGAGDETHGLQLERFLTDIHEASRSTQRMELIGAR